MASKVAGWISVLAVCSLFVAVFQVAGVSAQTQSNTYTTYNNYNPSANNYALDGLYCATYDSSQSLAWRSQSKWTAFCGTAGGPMGPSLCGRCLSVTNPSTQQSVTVRILDQCSNGGLDLETDAFNAIDSNGAGYQAGHLYTTYTFVNC
uniref:PR-4 protein n=1 Tax=Pseudotsuga menziesii TaxID=3357 RepID=H9BQS2_PSEMZ|nr:PR-4 protein [Pseudotsuga menziesii]